MNFIVLSINIRFELIHEKKEIFLEKIANCFSFISGEKSNLFFSSICKNFKLGQ